jgi:hypothetical protein
VPVVKCPNCPTQLRVPDGVSGNVQCTRCRTIFAVGARPATAAAPTPPAATPPPRPAPAARPATPAARPAPVPPQATMPAARPAPPPVPMPLPPPPPVPAPPRGPEVDFNFDDMADEPRGRDDDDYDDGPRYRRGRRDDRDDDRPRTPAGPAKVGIQLIGISFWLYLGTFGVLALMLLLAWAGVPIPSGLMILPGLLGLANWIVGLTGLGFAIAGPSRARGLAIAATVVAGLHLVMTFVIANNRDAGKYGFGSIWGQTVTHQAMRALDLQKRLANERDPARAKRLAEELQDLGESMRETVSDPPHLRRSMRWGDLATLLPYSDVLIGTLAYRTGDDDDDLFATAGRETKFSEYLLPLFGGLLEVARLVLLVLVIGAVAGAVRARDPARKAGAVAIIVGVTALVAMIVIVVVLAVADSSKTKLGGDPRKAMDAAASLMNTITVGELLCYLTHLVSLIFPALLAVTTAAACRRAR